MLVAMSHGMMHCREHSASRHQGLGLTKLSQVAVLEDHHTITILKNGSVIVGETRENHDGVQAMCDSHGC